MVRKRRGQGERGVAMVMTGLILVPLMMFAAFGVDLASWYARVSFLQKSADAAALAGTVWMPDLTKATLEAKASLRENGIIDKEEGGTDDLDVLVSRGTTATALRVVVTDNSATRYFSQVFAGNQALTRAAEAEYNLPIPLGSPLNYFGGDTTKNTFHGVTTTTTTVVWPADYRTRAPQNPACNVGTDASQGLGRWTSASSFDPNGFSGSTRCYWGVGSVAGSSFTRTAPPDYDTRVPTGTVSSDGFSPPCNAFASGTNGRWESTTVYNAGARYTSGTGSRRCGWAVRNTSSLPSTAFYRNQSNVLSSSRPCNVGYGSTGRYAATGAWSSSVNFTGLHSAGNQLCAFLPELQTTTTTTQVPDGNQIDPTRSPGFWAMIEGPGAVSPNGDAYNTRCYINNGCGSVENVQYKPSSDVDRGFWYVVKMPNVALGSVDINVFDASYDQSGSTGALAGDRNLGDSNVFPTELRVFTQSNPIDFSVRTPYSGATSGNQTQGSCYWTLGNQSSFQGQWRRLCTITAPVPGGTYLVNVQTTGSSGNGINGYAIEAVANGGSGTQPALYAYANMGMQNNNDCSGSGCTPPPATFYVAEIGPQYAGKTLVVDLWDPGDASGNASLFPKMPSLSVPKAVVDVPAADCEYTSSPSPSVQQSGSDGGGTGAIHATPQPSDFAARCGIRSTISGNRQFNGEWLSIRVAIPASYTCTQGVNPETTAGSCWWGIEYNFSDSANDVTTWRARIEGNPVHLTQ